MNTTIDQGKKARINIKRIGLDESGNMWTASGEMFKATRWSQTVRTARPNQFIEPE